MYTYQQNTYYAIIYPVADATFVLGLTRDLYPSLAGHDAEVTVGDSLLFVSTNSDLRGRANVGFIAIDEMTQESPTFPDASSSWNVIVPGKLLALEEQYKEAVAALTDLYAVIVAGYKTAQRNTRSLFIGWVTISCAWEETSDSDVSLYSDDDQPAHVSKPIAKTAPSSNTKTAAPRTAKPASPSNAKPTLTAASGASKQPKATTQAPVGKITPARVPRGAKPPAKK